MIAKTEAYSKEEIRKTREEFALQGPLFRYVRRKILSDFTDNVIRSIGYGFDITEPSSKPRITHNVEEFKRRPFLDVLIQNPKDMIVKPIKANNPKRILTYFDPSIFELGDLDREKTFRGAIVYGMIAAQRNLLQDLGVKVHEFDKHIEMRIKDLKYIDERFELDFRYFADRNEIRF